MAITSWYSLTPAVGAAPVRVDIYGVIGEGPLTVTDFIGALRTVEAAPEIELRISSEGGEVDAGHAIFNALDRLPGRITAYIDGMAASMATVIAMAADRIVMAENATWMIHNPMTIAVGGVRDMDSASKRLAIMTDAIVRAYLRHSTADEAQIRAWMDAETWMSAAEAKAAGFVHDIGPASQLAARVNLARLPNIPGRIAAILATAVPSPAKNQPANEEIPMADNTPATQAAPATAPDHLAEIADLKQQIETLKAAKENQLTDAQASAVKAERQRVADIRALSYVGAEACIDECIATGVSKVDALAKLNELERTRRSVAAANLKAGGAAATTVEASDPAPAAKKPADQTDDELKAAFAATDAIRRDHLTADHYVKHVRLQAKKSAGVR